MIVYIPDVKNFLSSSTKMRSTLEIPKFHLRGFFWQVRLYPLTAKTRRGNIRTMESIRVVVELSCSPPKELANSNWSFVVDAPFSLNTSLYFDNKTTNQRESCCYTICCIMIFFVPEATIHIGSIPSLDAYGGKNIPLTLSMGPVTAG